MKIEIRKVEVDEIVLGYFFMGLSSIVLGYMIVKLFSKDLAFYYSLFVTGFFTALILCQIHIRKYKVRGYREI